MPQDKPKRKRVQVEPPRSVGRPKTGKRSNPDYQQVSAWVRKDTYEQVTTRLFVKEKRREFSDLVQALLVDWLRTR